jgi:CheY-like chemotaxis protein
MRVCRDRRTAYLQSDTAPIPPNAEMEEDPLNLMIHIETQPHSFAEDHSARLETHIVAQNEFFDHSRILIVDRDENLLHLHADILRLEGYTIELANEGPVAAKMLAEGQFDLAIIDRQTPILGGETFVNSLRSVGIRVPILMLSGSPVADPLCPSVEHEVAAHLVKPIRPAELIRAVFQTLYHAERAGG